MDTFRPFSPTHAAVLLVFATTVSALVMLRRRLGRERPDRAARLDLRLGVVAIVVWVFATFIQFLPRYYDRSSSLPLQVCDFTILAVPRACDHLLGLGGWA
jgi:uncharacterized membrane protein YwaF